MRVVKLLVIAFGAVASLYVIAGFALHLFLPACAPVDGPPVSSPSGRYAAQMASRVCENPSDSWTEVRVSSSNRSIQLVAERLEGDVEVRLEWQSDSRLRISYLGARAQDRPGSEWPAIEVRPR